MIGELYLLVSNFQLDVDRDSTLRLSVHVVNDPHVQERAIAQPLRLLLDLLDGTLVNASKLVYEMARRRQLTKVDVAEDDGVGVRLLLGHLTQHRVV